MKRTMMSKNTNGVDLLENEIQIMKKIKCERCVQLEEVIGDEEEGRVYLAIEYVTKGSLESIKQNIRLTEKQVWKYIRQLCQAVEYLHNIGIVHRDIKPDNLLIDNEDNLKLCDFGVSVIVEGDSDILKNTAGTNYFFSPESCKGEAYSGKKADIWAIGVTMYNLLFNEFPFTGNSNWDNINLKKNENSGNIETKLKPNGALSQIANTYLELYKDIREKELEFEEEVDEDLIELFQGLLHKDEKERYSFEDIRANQWITNNGKVELLVLPT